MVNVIERRTHPMLFMPLAEEADVFESWASCELQRLFKIQHGESFVTCFPVHLADLGMVWGCYCRYRLAQEPGAQARLTSPVQLQPDCPDCLDLFVSALSSMGILWLWGLFLHFCGFICILKTRKQCFYYYRDFLIFFLILFYRSWGG